MGPRAGLTDPRTAAARIREGAVWVERGDRVVGVSVRTGRVLGSMAVARGSRLAIVGSWLAVGRGRSLSLVVLGRTTRGGTVTLPAPIGAFAFAVV